MIMCCHDDCDPLHSFSEGEKLEAKLAVAEKLAKRVESVVLLRCQGCYLKWPLTSTSYTLSLSNSQGLTNLVEGVGEGDSHEHPRGGLVYCTSVEDREALDEWDALKEKV